MRQLLLLLLIPTMMIIAISCTNHKKENIVIENAQVKLIISTVREVVIAEQLQRLIQSDHAILEFEDLRFQWVAEQKSQKAGRLLDQMESILREEITRTELSLLAATRDSRLGFQQECDYVYTPYSLKEKLEVLNDTLKNQLPSARI